MQIQTIFQAGNSDVVAIPKGFGFKRGEKVVVEKVLDGNSVLIKRVSGRKQKTTASEAEFQKWLKVFMEENGEILDELAQR